MGLSDEERVRKFYRGLRYWRKSLLQLSTLVPKYRRDAHGMLKDWASRIDLLAGLMFRDNDYTGWFVGPGRNNFFDIHSEHYDLGRVRKEYNWPQGSRGQLEDEVDFYWAARKLSSGPFVEDEDVRILGAWWDQFSFAQHLLYPLYRYPDELFSGEIKETFLKLVGEMANRRFQLVSMYDETYLKAERDYEDYEQAFLNRYKLFYTKLVSVDFNDQFDARKEIYEIGRMSLPQLKKAFEDLQEAEFQKEREAPVEEKLNGVTGPEPRDQQELEQLVYESESREEAERAIEELATHYSYYVGTGALARFEKRKTSVKKRKKKASTGKKTRKLVSR